MRSLGRSERAHLGSVADPIASGADPVGGTWRLLVVIVRQETPVSGPIIETISNELSQKNLVASEKSGGVNLIYRVSKFRLVFMNAMIGLIGLACLGAVITQIVAWSRHSSTVLHGGSLVAFSPIFALMAYWGTRSLLTMRGKDLRLEANRVGVTWVFMRGKKWATWGSLDPFCVDTRRKTVIATVTGPDVSPDIAADGVFTLSAQAIDIDETDLARELNELRRQAVGDAQGQEG
jgi:hypothetical protein